MARRPQRVSADNKPPRGTAEKVERWAAGGSSMKAIARSLGVSSETLRVWMDRHPTIQEAWDAGMEAEHARIHGRMMQAIDEGNITAMIFMMKTRHGYREGDQTSVANKVSVTFNLPGAMPLAQFKGRVIEHGEPHDD